MCPFPPVHGNRTRFVGLLKWLRGNNCYVTFILQPLDVEGSHGLDQLANLVDRLEVVLPQDVGVTRRMKRAAHCIIRAALPAWFLARFRTMEGTIHSDGGHIDNWCWSTTCTAVARAVARDKPFAVLTEYALLSKCLDDIPPGVLKIIDTVEVFFRNEDRFRTEGLVAPMVCTSASEKSALGRADLLVAIQKNDARALRELYPTKRVITVPHASQSVARSSYRSDAKTILYVASSNPFNIHGLGQFVQWAWPEIVTRVPQATLRIVGSISAPDVGDARIEHVGQVSDAQLTHEYQTATVVINPQVAGTGLKIKCVEALSAGCPLVTNAAGADGLEDGAGWAYRLATNWTEFSEHVVALLIDTEARRALEEEARVFADRMFSAGAVFAELGAVFDSARQGGSEC